MEELQQQEQSPVKQTKKDLFWEIFRFLIVGGTATVVDYVVYYLMRRWILPPSFIAGSAAWDTTSLFIAIAVGFTVGLIVNWILSVKFVFRAVKNKEEVKSTKSFLIFTLIGLCGLAITELGVLILVTVIPTVELFGLTAFLGLPWEEWIAKVIMTCLVLVWNYLGRKIFIFKS